MQRADSPFLTQAKCSNMNQQNAFSKHTRIQASDPIDQILEAVDLRWSVLKAPVAFAPTRDGATQPVEIDGYSVLYRSDTKQKLAIVPSGHRVWQPREIIDFYLSFSAFYGLGIESVGYVQGGRELWALLNAGHCATFSHGRSVSTYLLLSTSYNGMLAAKATSLCILQPGALALPAAPGKPMVVHIARSPEFLTPGDLTAVGELMRECISFPSFLRDLAQHTPSEAQVKRVIAAAFGSRGADPSVPSVRALKAVLSSLREGRRGAAAPNSLDLVYALAHVSDARERSRRGEDITNSTWFGAGAKRKQRAVRALARMLTPY